MKSSGSHQLGLYHLEPDFFKIPWPGKLYWATQQKSSARFLVHELRHEDFPWLSDRQWQNFTADLEQYLIYSHPALLSYRDLIHIDKTTTYLVSEAPFLPTPESPKTLKELLQQVPKGKISERDALAALNQITEGIQYLHAQGTTHQLLHDQAVFIDWRQKPLRLKIGLYGLASLLPPNDAPDSILPYISPENRKTPNRSDQPNVDLYALGVLLWQMLTGENQQPSLEHFRTAEANTQPLLLPLFSETTRDVFERTLNTAPHLRYPRCHPLLKELKAAEDLHFPNSQDPPPITMISQFHPQVDDTEVLPSDPIPYETEQSRLKQTLQALVKRGMPASTDVLAHAYLASQKRLLPESIPETWEKEAIRLDERLAQKQTTSSPHILLLLVVIVLLIFLLQLWR